MKKLQVKLLFFSLILTLNSVVAQLPLVPLGTPIHQSSTLGYDCSFNNCNLISNGGFENSTGCGPWDWYQAPPSSLPQINCWSNYRETPDLFKHGCTNTITVNGGYSYNLGINTWNTIPIFNSHDAYTNSNNNTIVGLFNSNRTGYPYSEAIQTRLRKSLAPNKKYLLKCWAMVFDDYLSPVDGLGGTKNHDGGNTGTISFCSSPIQQPTIFYPYANSSYPAGLNQLTQYTLPKDNIWHQFEIEFTYTGNANAQYFTVGTILNGKDGQKNSYILIDDVELYETTFTYNPPKSVCVNSGAINLNNYLSNPTNSVYSFSGIGVSHSGNNWLFNPTTVGNYEITLNVKNGATDGCEISETKAISVVDNVKVAANAAPAILCAGEETFLYASNCDSYNWGPAIGLNNTFGNVVNANPGTTTTYTVTGINACGASQASVTVSYVECNNECAACSQVLAYPQSGGSQIISGYNDWNDDVYCIQNNVVITGIVNIRNAEIIFSNGAGIRVEEGAELHITGSHLYSCTTMWNGIMLAPGSVLTITNLDDKSSFIEDAVVAVGFMHTDEGLDNKNDVTIDINNTIFNRNKTGIYIPYYNKSNGTPNFPMNVSNCIFTSRYIPFISGSLQWDNVATLKSTTASLSATNFETPAVMTEPYINESVYSSTHSKAFLKSPYLFDKPTCGIMLDNVGYYNNISLNNSYSVVIGGGSLDEQNTNTNIFDNLYSGILANNANVTVNNSTFQKPFNITGKTCYGINSSNSADYQNLTVNTSNDNRTPNNAFFDMDIAIYSQFNTDVLINTCDFRSLNNHNIFNNKDNTAVWVFSENTNTLDLSYNNIYNYSSGIFHTNYADVINGNNNTGAMSFDFNHFGILPNNISTNLPKGAAIKNAITTASTFQIPTNATAPLEIAGNSVKDAYTGIKISYWQGNDVNVNGNDVAIVANPAAANNPNIEQYGIFAEGGTPGIGTQNQIANNTVHTNQTGLAQTTGIYCEMQSNSSVDCNDVAGAKHGIRFGADNTPTKFWDNKIHSTNTSGYTLDHSGIVGIRSSPNGPGYNGLYTCASNNQWLGTWGSNTTPPYKTNCINFSDATQSILWVNTTSPVTNPSGANAAFSFSISYSSTNGSILAATVKPGRSCRHCGDIIIDDPICCVIPHLPSIPFPRSTEQQIADGSLPIAAPNAAQRLYVMQHKLYNNLLSDTATLNGDSSLQAFIASNAATSFGNMKLIENEIVRGHRTNARQLIDNWTSNNVVDDNYKLYYNWLLNNGNSTCSNNIAPIAYLANLCPFTDGLVVYAARNMYNAITRQRLEFVNSCDETATAPQARSKQIITNDVKLPNNINIYPNPSKGLVNISLPLSKSNYKISVIDIYGKKVSEKVCSGNESLVTININTGRGLYLLNISNSDNSTTNKVIIH